jgi:hypothetical protein
MSLVELASVALISLFKSAGIYTLRASTHSQHPEGHIPFKSGARPWFFPVYILTTAVIQLGLKLLDVLAPVYRVVRKFRKYSKSFSELYNLWRGIYPLKTHQSFPKVVNVQLHGRKVS